MLTDRPAKPPNRHITPVSLSSVKRIPCLRIQEFPKKSRRCFFGVETWPDLVWDEWEPGEEYTKSLSLKIVNEHPQKLIFRPPNSKFFSTLHSQTLLLSPGILFTLPVTFRPREKCEYIDFLEFQGKHGTFRVPLRAVILQHALEIPELVELPPCAVHHSTQTTFTFCNSSKLQTKFSWMVDPPFHLSPSSGQLNPGEECKVTVQFNPAHALVFQAEARCAFGKDEENKCTVLLRGLCKYPHLQIVSPHQEDGCKVLEFGSVAIGDFLKKHFEIYNPTLVSTTFNLAWVRRPPLLDPVFHVEVEDEQIGPHSVVKVAVVFSPRTVDCTSVDYVCLTSLGGVTKDLLKMSGFCIGPIVTLSTSALDFGCVNADSVVTRSVDIINSSSVRAHFQFDVGTERHNVFAVEHPSVTVPGNSKRSLTVKFQPHHPTWYYKRITCLVLHRAPLFLDVIGTCHSKSLKPAILTLRHLSIYKEHVVRGLAGYPPDVLGAMLEDGKLNVDDNGALKSVDEIGGSAENNDISPQSSSPRNSPEESNHSDSTPSEADSIDNSASFPDHVTVQPSELFFYEGPASDKVTVTNHTKGKIWLMWSSGSDCGFSISPHSCELGPLKRTSFKISYRPKHKETFSAAQLECFAFYKVLKEQTYAEEWALCLPWCLVVRVSGHSFQFGNEPPVPKFFLQDPQIVFPALMLASYCSVLLKNKGDLPLIFRADPEDCPSVHALTPSGMVPPSSHQILTFISTPTQDNSDRTQLRLHLNAKPKHTQDLDVVAVAEDLSMMVEGDGYLFFKPTAVGCCSERTLWVKNFSRVPVEFQWKMDDMELGVLTVCPEEDTLQPNESRIQKWTFTPVEQKMYNMEPSLSFWPLQTPHGPKSHLTIEVSGLGSEASLQAENIDVDLGEVLIGSCRSFNIPVLNNSSCAVNYYLATQQTYITGLPDDLTQDPIALEILKVKGTIPAYCRLPIPCTVRPVHRAHYCWTISYHRVNASGVVDGDSVPLCHVMAEGVYPSLEVLNIHGCGPAEGLNRLQLWRLFNVDKFNAHLLGDPGPYELVFWEPTRESVRQCPSIFTPATLEFNFSAAPIGSEPSCILLLFKNTGHFPVQWSFLLPEDQHVELEYWAENGNFSPSELHLMKIQEQTLFFISPRSGKLQPGKQRVVRLTYRHDSEGTNRLAVLFRLSHGREIQLNFKGITVGKNRRYIHLQSSKHVFEPVAIGGFNPSVQIFELYNGGDLPLQFHIDTAPLDRLIEENFNHPVLVCLNPGGEVEPGSTALVEWIFFPLEEKSYSVEVPIHVVEGDSMLVTFEGHGLNKKDSQPCQELDGGMTEPSAERIPLPEQVVYLSEEKVCLGNIPVCSRSTRIFFLSNISSTVQMLYSWRINSDCQQCVRVHPEEGCLAPGQNVLCILTIQAPRRPAFLQEDLICEITNKKMLDQYHNKLKEWEETERTKNEFTLAVKDHPDKYTRDSGLSDRTVFTKKYKVVPPIRSSSSGPRPSLAKREKSQDRRTRPVTPHPLLLHLEVTAHFRSPLDVQTQCSSEVHVTSDGQQTPAEDGSVCASGQMSSEALQANMSLDSLSASVTLNSLDSLQEP